MTRHATGWRPQLPDHRDLSYNARNIILSASELPGKFDLWPNVPAIWNQLQEGACTAHGSQRAADVTLMKEGIALPEPPQGGAPFSRQAQYYWTRAIEGTTDQDAGGSVRDAVKVIATTGMAPETLWPYDATTLTTAPPATVVEAAKPNLAMEYQAVDPNGPGEPMRTAIASGLAIVFGFTVPNDFQDGSWNPATEVLPYPPPNGLSNDGHCVAITGYDFTNTEFPVSYFMCDNSWDTSWGGAWGGDGCSGGRFAMDYRYFGSQNPLATDLWVIQKVA